MHRRSTALLVAFLYACAHPEPSSRPVQVGGSSAPLPPAPTLWYIDADGDGYGDPSHAVERIYEPVGWVPASVGEDCDDGDPLTHPGAHDWCGDDWDEDCSGSPRSCTDWGAEDADLLLVGDDPGVKLGYGQAPLGDQDGDGYDDLALGAPLTQADGSTTGAVYLFPGSSEGLDPDGLGLSAASGTILGDAGDGLGWALGNAGDVNGDGVEDLLVGWGGYDNQRVSVFLGPITGELHISDAYAELVGWENSAQHHPGHAAGDTDGDGLGEILVTRWDEHEAYLVLGGTSGTVDLATQAIVIGTDDATDRTGYDAVGLGDSDGDGLSDVAIGAFMRDGSERQAGATFVFHGPVTASTLTRFAEAAWYGEHEDDFSGAGLAAPGDMNGDGFADLLIGAYHHEVRAADAGATYLVLGPFGGERSLEEADCILLGPGEDAYAGDWLAPAGDWNGDGRPDVVVGYGDFTDALRPSQASVLLGPLEGIHLLEQADHHFTFTIDETDLGELHGQGAGDLDGDGFDELVFGHYSVDAEEPWGGAYLFYGRGDL